MKEKTIEEELAYQKGYTQGFKDGLVFDNKFPRVDTVIPSGICPKCGTLMSPNYPHNCFIGGAIC